MEQMQQSMEAAVRQLQEELVKMRRREEVRNAKFGIRNSE